MRTFYLLLVKRFSRISLIFIFVACLLFSIIAYVNAKFNLDNYSFLIEYKVLQLEYLNNLTALFELLGVIFVVLLSGLEISTNFNRFEAYFVANKGKNVFYIIKVFCILTICFLLTLMLYFIFITIYLIRFKPQISFCVLINGFFCFYLLLLFYFCIAYLFLLLFKNYFSLFFLFALYFLTKAFNYNSPNSYIKYIVPIIDVNPYLILRAGPLYASLLCFVLFLIGYFIFLFTDYKC